MAENEDETVPELGANRIIEAQLTERIAAIEAVMNADVVAYLGPIFGPSGDLFKDAVEGISGKRRRTIVCVLETSGGYVTAAERIANILRHHYRRVEFLVPSAAMSAGTVLAMSGDAIHMDYASTLGPIDPQLATGNRLVPALGYLEQFERLVEKSKADELSTAELAYLVQNFDPAELYQYEQERELSIALLEEWLVKYKFREWKTTKTKKKRVTTAMKRERAREIATKLNKTDHWHSHSRGISMEVLQRDLKLEIDDFGKDEGLRNAVRDYYHLLKDYSLKRGHELCVINRRGMYAGF